MKTAAIVLGALWAAAGASQTPYAQVAVVPLGSPERWDYVVADLPSGRVYVAHADRIDVVDGRAATVVGSVSGVPGGTHGIAIASALGKGFTDDGEAGVAMPFDLRTLVAGRPVPAANDADAVAFERRSGHVFVVGGDPGTITVVDPRNDRPVATIMAGEALEYAAAGAGRLFVAGKGRGDLVVVDTANNRIRSHWPAPGCRNPHGLAYDAAGDRVFMGCVNRVMVVLDGRTGRIVATLPIGRGSDAVAWDPVRHRLFSANGLDGTISVFQQESADRYRPLGTIATRVSGRTMAVDPGSGRLFVAAADTDPPATPGGRPKPRTGTLALLIFAPRS